EIIPPWVRLVADAVGRSQANVSVFTKVIHEIGIHKQDLVSGHEILPGIIPVLLGSVVPHAEIAGSLSLTLTLQAGLPVPQERCGEILAAGATQSASEL